MMRNRILLILLALTEISFAEDDSSFYSLQVETDISNDAEASSFVENLGACIVKCSIARIMKLVAFDKWEKKCKCYGYKTTLHGNQIEYLPKSGSTVAERHLKIGWQWMLRARSGSNVSLYDTWTSNGPVGNIKDATENPANFGVFKSALVDHQWSNCTKIRVSTYVQGKEEAFMLFNNTGTSKLSFWQTNLLVKSRWTDLKTGTIAAPFTVVGTESANRRFTALKAYVASECGTEVGWMLVKDPPSWACSWESEGTLPAFPYNPNSTAGPTRGWTFGDVFAIKGLCYA